MAHKELITQYAKQLTQANQRVINLEVNIADVLSELDKAKAEGTRQHNDGTKEIASLHKELTSKEEAIKSLRTKMQHTIKETDGLDASLAATERNPSKHPDKTKERVVELESTVNSQNAQITKLKKQIEEADEDLPHRDVNSIKLQEKIKDLNARIRSLGAQKGGLTAKINSLEASKEQAAEWKQEVTALRAQVDDLKTELEQEKKRKREPENGEVVMVKRCQRCSPVVIDLEEDGDGKSDQDASDAKPAAVVQQTVKSSVDKAPAPSAIFQSWSPLPGLFHPVRATAHERSPHERGLIDSYRPASASRRS